MTVHYFFYFLCLCEYFITTKNSFLQQTFLACLFVPFLLYQSLLISYSNAFSVWILLTLILRFEFLKTGFRSKTRKHLFCSNIKLFGYSILYLQLKIKYIISFSYKCFKDIHVASVPAPEREHRKVHDVIMQAVRCDKLLSPVQLQCYCL